MISDGRAERASRPADDLRLRRRRLSRPWTCLSDAGWDEDIRALSGPLGTCSTPHLSAPRR